MSSEHRQPTTHWYAIATRARHEKIVHQQLVDRNVESFLPTVVRSSRWSDRTKRITWPLFPGYCFARFDAADFLPVLRCSGALRIVSFGGAPVPVADHELDGIRLLVSSALPYDPWPQLREGTSVNVTNGPLRGVVGTLIRKDVDRASVVLSVELLGCGARVELPAGDIASVA
jgi:transcription antitermination factor NusG